jgi:hypothetical protein
MLFAQSSDQNSQGAMEAQDGSSAAMAPQPGENDGGQAQMQGTVQRGDANSDERKPGAMATPMPSDEATPMGETRATGEQNSQEMSSPKAADTPSYEKATPADSDPASTETEIPK